MQLLKNVRFRLLLEITVLILVVFIAAPARGRQKILLMAPALMPAAVTSTLLWSTNDTVCVGVAATADADTTAAFTLPPGGWAGGANPAAATLDIGITNIQQVAAGVSLWAITAQSNTAYTATKGTGAGSGAAGNQIQVYVRRKR